MIGRALAVAAVALATACVRLPAFPPDEAVPELRLPRDVRPVRYELELAVDPGRAGFDGRVAIEVELDRRATSIWLHARDLTVHAASVEAGGRQVAAQLVQVTPDGVARLTAAEELPAGRATVRVTFGGAWNDRLAGLYRVQSGGAAYAYTQFEPIDARRAFPCFDDPGFKVPFEVTLVVAQGHVAVSNAPALSDEPAGPGSRRVRFAPTPPLPTYLVFAAAGPFDVVAPPPLPPTDLRPRPLPVRALAPRGTVGRLTFALEATRALLPALEERLGIAFPYAKLDQLAAPDFAHAGMENAGAILYGAGAVEVAPGVSPERRRVEVAGLVAHELAHQWFGDLVTPGWWDDVWLNESFATFLTWGALEAWRPDAGVPEQVADEVEGILRQDELTAAPAVRQAVRHTSDIEGTFDAIAYVKGAAALRGFERVLGADRFRAGVHAYLEEHAHGTGSTDALVASLSRAAGRDLAPALRSVLDRPGPPLVQARAACDPPGPRVELQISRYRPLGSAAAGGGYVVPVCVRYEAAGALGETCAIVEGARAALPLPACPRWIMPAAGGNAYHRWTLPAPERARLQDVGFAHLTAAERLSTAHAILADARSGAVTYRAALEALAPLARDGARGVAVAPMPALREAIEHLVPEASRPRARSASADLYRARLREVGLAPLPGEPLDRAQLRRDLLGFMVEVARDPEVLRVLGGAGAAYAGAADGRWHPEAIGADLAGVALDAAVASDDVAVFDALLERLPVTEDAELRRRILAALGSARDPALSARALALAVDPRLRVDERARTLFAQASRPESREAAWRALRSRWDLLAATLPASTAAHLPGVAAGFCDRERLPEIRRFLGSRVERIPGAPRRLAEVTERIELCAALRDAQGASAAAWFAR